MKKLAVICLVVCMIVSCAYAEELSFKDKTIDELLILKQSIEDEIQNRLALNGEKEAAPGYYRVGLDLPKGVYEICAINSQYARIFVFENEQKLTEWATESVSSYKLYEYISSGTKTYRVPLDENNVLYLDSGATYTIKAVEPIF